MTMISIAVQDQSQVSEARRQAGDIARRSGFNEIDTGRASLIATELATNLIKHGRGGEMLIGTFDDQGQQGIELLALDRGPGIGNVAMCLEDGYSSAGTAGHGLGAVHRQSHLLEIASWPSVGTAVLSRIVAGKPGDIQLPKAQIGAVSIPKPGEDVCGDAWSVSNGPSGPTLLVADGLGHGPEAAEASVEAVRLFHRFNGHQVPTLLDYVHGGLRATRGAAVSIARFDQQARKVVYSGIGNIAGVIAVNNDLKRMVSMAGTAGYNVRKIQAFDYPFSSGLVILHSDGLQSSWTIDRYPNLASFHPTLIAGILYRDLSRGRDDATVLVAKW
jgi:anti-sigma regulatory factor (Ser/Thr protein kinase)